MAIDTITASDLELRDAIINELDWDSEFDAGEIAVSARGGAVTLTGSIDSYAGKLAAERAAKRVRGVRAVANDIRVAVMAGRGDSDIARDAAWSLASRPSLPKNLQAVVRNGHVTLSGTVRTLFQRVIAERAVRHIVGVKDVVNHIAVERASPPRNLAAQVRAALGRDAAVGTANITVTMDGEAIVLRGTVASWAARDAAEHAAMHAPHVTALHNEIAVVEREPDNVDEELC